MRFFMAQQYGGTVLAAMTKNTQFAPKAITRRVFGAGALGSFGRGFAQAGNIFPCNAGLLRAFTVREERVRTMIGLRAAYGTAWGKDRSDHGFRSLHLDGGSQWLYFPSSRSLYMD
jgi:hypothetical protein